ncbi:MAG: peptidylprolyl isomerase [Chloroflexota bacterium]
MCVNRLLGGYRWIILILILAACGSETPPTPIALLETPTKRATLLPDDNFSMCQSIPAAATSGPEEVSLFPPVNQDDHIRGMDNADVTIIEYGDFQCPGCAALSVELSKLEETFAAELRVVFRQLPLYDIHDKALVAAQAAEVASDEGKFWEMHDLFFENYGLWNSMTTEDFNNWLVMEAVNIGLEPTIFHNKMNSQEIIDRVENLLEQGLSIGLRSTPFLLINGQIYNGPKDYNSLAQIIRLISLGKRQFTACPDMFIDPLKQYIVNLQTEQGDIIIQLFADKAPVTVNSFVFLARSGWYDNITFHKVVPGIALTGDPSGTGLGGPGFLYQNEINPGLNFDQPGMVAMMNSGVNTNGSQFFITSSPQEELNGYYTIFGEVISGMDVLSRLTLRNPDVEANPPPGDLLIKVTVVEK